MADVAELDMHDLNDKEVHVQISESGNVVWVNVDGKCLLRVTNPVKVQVEDGRPKCAAAS